MGKKLFAVLLSLILVGGAGAGVYFWRTSGNHDNTATVATVNKDIIGKKSGVQAGNTQESVLQSVSESGEVRQSDDVTLAADNDSGEEDYIETNNLSVIKIVDTAENMEVTPREVLGDEYNSSYMRLDSDKSFRINLGYKGKSGTYSLNSIKNIITVIYEDGSTETFSYTTDENDDIAYIVVPYGDYEIYFG